MKKVIYAVLAFSPILAFAQAQTLTLGPLQTLIIRIRDTINLLIPVLVGVAVLYFFWGLIQFLRASGDEKAAAAGKSHMIYGVIAIAVMLSLYGIIAFLQGTLGIDPGANITIPRV